MLSINPYIWLGALGLFLIILLLLFLSGCISASENAFFSLSSQDQIDLKEDSSKGAKTALLLINEPDRKTAAQQLLATILILNNFINITLIIVSTTSLGKLWTILSISISKGWTFAIEVILITFILVLFGEIIPKIYATQNNKKLVIFTSQFINYSKKILFPFVWLLSKSTSLIDDKIVQKKNTVSIEELNRAIDLTSDDDNIEEKNILKGIVNFGNISARQIMCSRLDVKAISIDSEYDELLTQVKEFKFSRIPVYKSSFDEVVGILYMKDLTIKELSGNKKSWIGLIRDPFFVPANKKIDDLLKEFQEKRMHMAIVVDEYGGSLGIVTMEDILEEIFGDIKDEFDDDEITFTKIDDSTYIFEAKTLLTDICRILEKNASYFDELKGESETLGGLVMELFEKIPSVGESINAGQISFTIEAANQRKIKRIKMQLTKEELSDND